MLVGRPLLARHDGTRMNIRPGRRKRGGTVNMARIVIRRSRIPDQSAPVEARPPWAETIAAGGASTLAVTAAAVCRATQEGEAGWRPINSISHILWGSEAADQRQFTLRYTVSALLLKSSHAGSGPWCFVSGAARNDRHSFNRPAAGLAFRSTFQRRSRG